MRNTPDAERKVLRLLDARNRAHHGTLENKVLPDAYGVPTVEHARPEGVAL